MSGFELADEALAYSRAMNRIHFARLEESGIPLRTIGNLCGRQFPIGAARAAWGRDSLWEPCEDGQPCLIVPACEHRIIEIEALDGFPLDTCEPVDLIALRTDQPNRWAWRTGNAWAFGEELLADPTGEPVQIVGDPIGWIRSAGYAVCILDWSNSSPAWAALRHGPPLLVENEHLRRRLQRALAASIRLPDMEVAHAA